MARRVSRRSLSLPGKAIEPTAYIYIYCWLGGLSQAERSDKWVSRQRTQCAARHVLSVKLITSERDSRRGVLPVSSGFMGC